ncbi:MAG: peptidoglycan-binding domain-containing protein, partial [Pseudomonadota bacterium]
ETIFVCNGVVYRASYYQDERVYEIVSSDEDSPRPETPPISIPESATDEFVELRLESPFLRGDRVRLLQTSLDGIGFDVGRIDGIFGRDTDAAVRDFQDWYGLPVTGVVDIDTANAIVAEYAAVLAPPPDPTETEESQSAPVAAPDNTDEASQNTDEETAPESASESSGSTDEGQQDTTDSGSESETEQDSEPEQESESESSN